VGNAVVQLNKLSKASDDARDKAFTAPRLAQFTAELATLRGVLNQIENQTISASDAQKEFNRLGLQNEEQARARVVALDGIVSRLKEEKSATEAAAKADKDRLTENAEGQRIAAVIAALEAEKQKNIELDIIKEQLAEKDKKRGEELLRQAGMLAERTVAPPEPALPLVPGREPTAEEGGLAFITEGVQATDEEVIALEDHVQSLVDQAPGVCGLGNQFKTAADEIAFANERAI